MTLVGREAGHRPHGRVAVVALDGLDYLQVDRGRADVHIDVTVDVPVALPGRLVFLGRGIVRGLVIEQAPKRLPPRCSDPRVVAQRGAVAAEMDAEIVVVALRVAGGVVILDRGG